MHTIPDKIKVVGFTPALNPPQHKGGHGYTRVPYTTKLHAEGEDTTQTIVNDTLFRKLQDNGCKHVLWKLEIPPHANTVFKAPS